MGTKRRAVVNAEGTQLARIEAMVKARRYKTLSDFVREAVDEKLARIDRELLDDEVARYCAAGYADEDMDMVAAQAFGPEGARPKRERRRAAR